MSNQVIDINDLKVGSYVSFDDENYVLFKVKFIDYSDNSFEYYDYEYGWQYEYIKNIKKIFNFIIDK